MSRGVVGGERAGISRPVRLPFALEEPQEPGPVDDSLLADHGRIVAGANVRFGPVTSERTETPITDEQLAAIRASCTRFLNGHGLQSPTDLLRSIPPGR